MNKRKVLVIDDEPHILSSIADLLEDDFSVRTTTDPEEALRILRSEEIMVILSDQRMPKMTGDAFLERARQIAEATRILMTGYSDMEALVRAVNNGQIYGYITKPWDPVELKVAVRKAADHYELVRDLGHERQLLHILMNSIPDSIYFKDADCRFTRINRAKAQVLGIESPEKAVGKQEHDFFPAEQVLDTYADEQRIIETGVATTDRVVKLARAEGRPQWFSTTKVPILDREHRIVGLCGINRNITERKEAEERLKQSEQRLRALVDHHPDGVCLLDENHHLILANTTGQKHLKRLGNGAPGEKLLRLQKLDIKEALSPREDGLPHEVSIDGHIFEIEGCPIPGEIGDADGWVLVIRNVTTERETRKRIQQQYHLASMGQLAAGIAHDFNNVLTVIMGTSQLMEIRPDIPEDVKGDLRTIYVQGQRASQMVRQVLDFSRKTVVERQSIDLVPVLKETVKMMQRTLPEIQIEARVASDACTVETNLTQLQQIVTNLAVNARDAMPGGGALRFELSALTLTPDAKPPIAEIEPGDWVVLTVSDTGTGIPPDVLKHIFEPFFTTKEVGKGTGLGLSQVYGIVKQHNGFIDVESEVGKGTTFAIYLPRVVTEAESLVDITMDIPKGQGQTILLVEDQAEVLRLTRSMLENLNYQVVSANSGEEALAIYDAHRGKICLVLTDVVMPKVSGPALAISLREKAPHLPVVMMTGYSPGQLKETLAELGIDGWLEKPISLHSLAQMIHKSLMSRESP